MTISMSYPAVWGRPGRPVDSWVRDFFGPAATDTLAPRVRADWIQDFSPFAEVGKDGDDAVVRLELPAHVTGDAITASYDAGVLTVRVAGVYAGTEPQRIEISGK